MEDPFGMALNHSYIICIAFLVVFGTLFFAIPFMMFISFILSYISEFHILFRMWVYKKRIEWNTYNVKKLNRTSHYKYFILPLIKIIFLLLLILILIKVLGENYALVNVE